MHDTVNRPRLARGRAAGFALLAALALLAAGCDVFRSNAERIEQAREAVAVGNFREASLELKSVLDSDPENAEARLLLAEVSLAVGDAQSADKELQACAGCRRATRQGCGTAGSRDAGNGQGSRTAAEAR